MGKSQRGLSLPGEDSDFGDYGDEFGDDFFDDLLEEAYLQELDLMEDFLGLENLFDDFEDELDDAFDNDFDFFFEDIFADVSTVYAELLADYNEQAAPLLTNIITQVQAAASTASAAEETAAAKKASVEATIVARGQSAGLDQSSANSMSSAVTAPLDALGAASALASTASGIMLTAGALLGTIQSGKEVDADVLASLEEAANEAEVAATQVEIIVSGAVAAMDVVVKQVIAAASSASGSGKLAAAESMVAQILQSTINEKITVEAQKKVKEVGEGAAYQQNKLSENTSLSGDDAGNTFDLKIKAEHNGSEILANVSVNRPEGGYTAEVRAGLVASLNSDGQFASLARASLHESEDAVVITSILEDTPLSLTVSNNITNVAVTTIGLTKAEKMWRCQIYQLIHLPRSWMT